MSLKDPDYQPSEDDAPDWNQPVSLSVTPGDLIHTLFATAANAHTGWESCVDNNLVLSDLAAMDERTGNYARLVEQEFTDEENTEIIWHDWAVELRLGDVLITGHWTIQITAAPLDWDWCTREAQNAFEKTAMLVGKRVRRTLAVEDNPDAPPPPDRRRH